MKVALDYDQTITSNFAFYQQLIHMLHKSGHVVIVISGCKPERAKEVEWDMQRMNIYYDFFFSRPANIGTGPLNIGLWKKFILNQHKIDLWFDNEVKNYQDAGVNFNDIETEIIDS